MREMLEISKARMEETSTRPSTFVGRCSDRFDIICCEIIFVIAAVHGARVTTPALMDLPVDLRSDPTASDRYRRGAFKSICGHARVVATCISSVL